MAGSRSRARSFALTRRGWGFVVAGVALLVVSYIAGSAQVQLAAALVIALLVVGFISARLRLPLLQVSRSFAPLFVAAGRSALVTIAVHNRSRLRAGDIVWRDAAPWTSEGTGRLPTLRGGGTGEVRYRIVPPRRGVVEIGPLFVDVEDPFGLVRGRRRVAGIDRVLVTPAVVPLADVEFGLAAGEGSARLVQRSMLGNDDDLMTREYRRGDAMRRIHWRVSARQGELMVRQEEQHAKPEVRLVVDTRFTAYTDAERVGGVAQSETFEWVVRMVASLGVHLHGSGFDVHVLETSRAQVAGFTNREARAEAFLASLASVTLVDERDPLAGRDPGAAGPLLAVLAEPDDEVIEWLARMRRPTELGFAFLPVWATHARETLDAAGWRCVVFRATDDPAAIWAAVMSLEVR